MVRSDPGSALVPPKSRLLIRAQELGRLETILDLFVENQVPHALMLLTGMQSNGRQRVLKAELDAVQVEVLELIEGLFIEQANLLQPLLHLPEYAEEPTYLQAVDMLGQGAPEEPIRAMLAGWFMTLNHPYPYIRARILARSISTQVRPQKKRLTDGAIQMSAVDPLGRDELPRMPDEQDVPMHDVKGRLTKRNRMALDRLTEIFPSVTCSLGKTQHGKRYIFRADYEGRRAQTEEMANIPDNLVDVLIDLTAALMEAAGRPTLN